MTILWSTDNVQAAMLDTSKLHSLWSERFTNGEDNSMVFRKTFYLLFISWHTRVDCQPCGFHSRVHLGLNSRGGASELVLLLVASRCQPLLGWALACSWSLSVFFVVLAGWADNCQLLGVEELTPTILTMHCRFEYSLYGNHEHLC